MAKEAKQVEKLTPEQARVKTMKKFYAAIARPVANVMHLNAKRIRLVGLEGMKAIMTCGKLLTEVRESLDKGVKANQEKVFGNWLKLEGMGFSLASAYNWMRVYDYARRYGVGMVSRLGVKVLTGASHIIVAKRLQASGELSPGQEQTLAKEIKRQVSVHKATKSTRKKLMKRTIKSVFAEAKAMVRTIVNLKETDADAQVRQVVSFCRDMLKEIGAEREWTVIERSQLLQR